MKKTELKRLIKPLVKECIHEILLEEGMLSNVVSEVAKGLGTTTLTEQRQQAPNEQRSMQTQASQTNAKMQEYRKSLMDSIGKDAYNGVDLFEGTQPTSIREPSKGDPDLGDPRDAGVDISSIIGNASAVWKAVK